MGRRRGGDKLFQRNRAKIKADYARKKAVREQKRTFLLAFEGSVTEPNYFEALFNDFKKKGLIAMTSYTFVPHHHTDPNGVLNDLLHFEKDGFVSKNYDYRWIVIDRDKERMNGGGHTAENFNNAIVRAGANKVKVAYSNPCFEIWLLLHFNYRDTAIHRDDLYQELKNIIGYQKNSQITYDNLKDTLDNAIRNAKRLKSSYETGGRSVCPESDNPVTTVFELIECLRNPKKKNS